jgi:hypothetical protein
MAAVLRVCYDSRAMKASLPAQNLLRRHVALPSDHGAWVFLISPLLIGLFAGGRWAAATPLLIVAALAAFLIRQPMTMAVKAHSGRRPREELPAARFWIFVYGVIGALAVGGLLAQGQGRAFPKSLDG